MVVCASAAYADTESFACKTPRFFGSTPCGAPFTVHPHDIVRVNLVSSGGHKVEFSGYVDGEHVGDTDYLHPGAVETYLWQNNGTNDVTMQVYAKTRPSDRTEVLAQGNYRIEP
jgi:hypothetical protein